MGTAGLRAAAMAWSRAFMTGSVADIRNIEGGPCHSIPKAVTSSALEVYLTRVRAAMAHYFGMPLGSIRITDIKVRNVTASTGDAEVQYALPASVVGNDNWVSYGYLGGQWKMTSCRPPIGGESTSTSGMTAPGSSCTAIGAPNGAGVRGYDTNGSVTIVP